MCYTVTPLSIDIAKLDDPAALLANAHGHIVLAATRYDRRRPIRTSARNEQAACEQMWAKYQNLASHQLTPDGGRSIMVGDMAEVTDEHGHNSHWIRCTSKWTRTIKPGAKNKVIEGNTK